MTHNPDALEPQEIPEAMWGWLARDIMMWLDMQPKTPRTMFRHLEAIGREIPQWLREEPEMKNLDHVPSKGTRCVLIYKAMQAARPTIPADPVIDAAAEERARIVAWLQTDDVKRHHPLTDEAITALAAAIECGTHIKD